MKLTRMPTLATILEHHFPRVVGDVKGAHTRHLVSCRRGMWSGKRENYVTEADGTHWGAPCSEPCQADHRWFDAVASTAEPLPVIAVQLRMVG